MTGRASGAADLLEALVAIPSTTGEEAAVVDFVEARLAPAGWICESIPVSPGRRDLFAYRGDPRVVLTTHADTVPPFVAPRREGDELFGRGACDAKGSLAAMILALESLPAGTDSGLLLLVGEERGSDGARAAAGRAPANARFLLGGEPTGNRFVAGSKGCLRVSAATRGEAAHSSIADGARSAVDPLVDFLVELRRLRFPSDARFGDTTFNVGVLEAGVAPNVVAGSGRAEIVFRTGIPVESVLEPVRRAAEGRADLDVPYRSDPIAFRRPRGASGPGDVVAFASDLPLLAAWGEPLLMGPGSISHAHAPAERVTFAAVEAAALLYLDALAGLAEEGEGYLEPLPAAPHP